MRGVAFLPVLGAAMLALGALISSAEAADIDASDLLAKAPQVEDTSGWYLRGDIGYVINRTPDWSSLDFTPEQSLDDAWVIGLGLGVRANDWLRFDITGDYRTQADYDVGGFTSDYEAATLLANVYVDLGTWNGFTPYVGAGVGAGYVSITDVAFLGTDIGEASGWGVAWALMAGVAVAVSPNWQVDLGYRYLSIESASLGNGLPDLDQSAHEIRIGARYLIQ
jgi:opacity protein-like surface antigen